MALAHRLPACGPSRPRLDLALFGSAGRWRWERRHDRELRVQFRFRHDVVDAPATAAQEFIECGARVSGKVETIGDLDCTRCALATAFRVGASPITDDDLDARMLPQPAGEHFGRTVV